MKNVYLVESASDNGSHWGYFSQRFNGTSLNYRNCYDFSETEVNETIFRETPLEMHKSLRSSSSCPLIFR